MVISIEMIMNLIGNMCSEITLSKSLHHLSVTNELKI